MGTPQGDQSEAAFEFPPGAVGYGELGDRGVGISGDFDEVDASVRCAQLILDTRLESEAFGLDLMRLVGELVEGQAAGVSTSRAPIKATVALAEVPVELPAGTSEKMEISTEASSGTPISSMAASSNGWRPGLSPSSKA